MSYLLLAALLFFSEGQSINFFSPKQDIEMGKASAEEAEKQITLVRSVPINQYIRSIAARLLPKSTLHQIPYEFHVVNSNEINSLGFPNGAIYIYRGLLSMAANDDEIAAIMAHEIGHVASRHATSQLSRQLLVQAPISISAGLTTMDGWKEQLTKLGVVFGVNAPFLHYSPEQEIEASAVASKLLTVAHFDPLALPTIFERVRDTGEKGNGPMPTFLYNHPVPESDRSDLAIYRAKPSAEFKAFQSSLRRLPKPVEKGSSEPLTNEALPNVFTTDSYQFNYPETWQVRRNGPNGAIIAPSDGIQTSPSGQDDVTHGVMVDMFDLTSVDKPMTLEQATNRLLISLRQRNQVLSQVPGAQSPVLFRDEPGLRTVLFAKAAVTDSKTDELVWVVTRMYYQNLFYIVFVAPEEEFASYQAIFEQIIRSVQLR